MEDSSVELEIQKSPSENSKVSLILNKGWSLGKKVAVTGVAISSVPFILPPLLVFSSLGFALAVPFGVMFASYACTEKIMSKLLPRPIPPSMLEHNIWYTDVEYGDNGGEGMDREMEEEEGQVEFVEDMKRAEELRIDMGEIDKGKHNESEIVEEEENGNQQGSIGWDEKEPIEKESKDVGSFEEEEERRVIVEELRRDNENFGVLVEGDVKPLEENKGTTMEEMSDHGIVDDLDKEEEPIRETMEVIEKGMDEKYVPNALEEEEKLIEKTKGTTVGERMDKGKVDNIEQEDQPMRKTKGLLEVCRNVDSAVEEKKKPSQEMKGITKECKDEKNVDKTGKEGTPIEETPGMIRERTDKEYIEEKEKKLVEESKGMIIVYRDEGSIQWDGEGPIVEMEKMEEGRWDVENEDKKPMEEPKGIIEEKRDGGVMEEEKKPIAELNLLMQGKNADENVDIVVEEGGRSERELEGERVSSNAENRREIANDSGFDMFDKDYAVHEHCIEDNKIPEEKSRGMIGEMRYEENVGNIQQDGVKPIEETEKMTEGRKDVENAEKFSAVEKPLEVAKGIIEEKREKGIMEEEKKPITETKLLMQGKSAEEILDIVVEGGKSEREMGGEKVTLNAENIREISDDSGLDEDYVLQGIEDNKKTPVEESMGMIEERRDEEYVGSIQENGVITIENMEKMAEGRDVENGDKISVVEIPVEETKGMIKERRDEGNMEGEKKPVSEMKLLMQGNKAEENFSIIVDGEKSKRGMEWERISSNAENIRKIADERGLEMFDEDYASHEQCIEDDEKKPIEELKGMGAGRGEEENVGSFQEDEVKPIEEMEKMSEGRRDIENEDNISVEIPMEETKGLMEERKDEGIMEEEKKPIAEMKLLMPGKKTDENLDNAVEECEKLEREIVSSNAENIREIADECGLVLFDEDHASHEQCIDEYEKKPVEELKGMKSGRRDEENVGSIQQDEGKPIEEMEKMSKGMGDVKNADNISEEKLMKETQGMMEERRDEGIMDEEKKPIAEMKLLMQGNKAEENLDNVVEEGRTIKREMKGKRVSSNSESVREITDESGLVLFDKDYASHEQCIEDNLSSTPASYYSSPSVVLIDHKADSESPHVSSKHESTIVELSFINMGEESADSVAHPVSLDITEFISAKGVSVKETAIPSNEVLYSEEKIWEQINAMRTIVGYKATLHATCVEELKALYLFTGIVPPASFEDPSDLLEVNKKLQFLMAIVGVK